ncbi:MAG: hypothetical protein KJ066_19615 [Acidobacteria bacterium]|nr:hypothetical protein [Acidobacteriota bacterium]
MSTLFDRVRINEGSSAQYACTFTDQAGVAITSGAISAIRCTLRDDRTGQIVNGRDAQPVLNANGGVLASDGAFALTLGPADTALVSETPTRTPHLRRLTFEVTFDAGVITHEVRFYLRPLGDIPMTEP